jgi:hypothetical protein
MHFKDGQNRSSASRCERPLSTSTMCISPPARGAAKCDVYCVIRSPVALRVNSGGGRGDPLAPHWSARGCAGT